MQTETTNKNAVQEFHLRLEMRACCLCCDDCVRWDQNCRVWVSCALLEGAVQYKAVRCSNKVSVCCSVDGKVVYDFSKLGQLRYPGMPKIICEYSA